MITDLIETNTLVWVGKNSQSGYIGRISSVNGSSAKVNNLALNKEFEEDVKNISEAVRAPIDEKNIISDWIDENLLDNCTQNGNEYLGWLQNEYPVFGKVHKDGSLTLKPMDSSIVKSLKRAILDLFSETDDIRISFRESDELKVTFYFII